VYTVALTWWSKDGFYDGTPLIKASSNSLIYVAANYRLGPWGLLVGTTVEKEKSPIANAGFWDQKAVLQWIQKHIESWILDIHQNYNNNFTIESF
jgi:carboxylesterase type B